MDDYIIGDGFTSVICKLIHKIILSHIQQLKIAQTQWTTKKGKNKVRGCGRNDSIQEQTVNHEWRPRTWTWKKFNFKRSRLLDEILEDSYYYIW